MYFSTLALSFALATCHAALLPHYSVIDLLLDVQRLHGYDTLLLAHNCNASIAPPFTQTYSAAIDEMDTFATPLNITLVADDATKFVQQLHAQLQVTVLQLNELGVFQLRRHFSAALISLVYIDGALMAHAGLLKAFVLALRHMTQTKVLFLLNCEEDWLLLRQLFQYAWQQKLINAAALFVDYQHTASYYSYTPFPEFTIESQPLVLTALDREHIYPYRLGNLRGYKLPYIIGGSDPRIIVYRQRGRVVVGGFVGHLLKSFAQKFNCTLVEPLPAKSNSFAPAQDLIAAVRNGTVDISAGLTFPSIPVAGYTYPYEQLNWCLMLPMEADIPGYDFFWIVFEGLTFVITLAALIVISVLLSSALYRHGYRPNLLDFILHDNCLRGVLGQSFSELARAPTIVRFIYLQICVLGILMTTSYNSYFATYWTSAPKVAPLRSYDDILYSGTKVFVFAPEYNELIGRTNDFKKYTPMFYIEKSFQKYLQTRDSFSTQYAYMVPTTKWVIFNAQQKIFTTPIFRLRHDLCFYNNIPMCFPVHDNSPYMETLYQTMLEADQAGLSGYWKDNGFLELIMAGKMTFADLSRQNQFVAMKVADLKYIWMGFGMMGVLVSLVFIGEQCTYHRKAIGKYVGRMWRRCCCCSRRELRA